MGRRPQLSELGEDMRNLGYIRAKRCAVAWLQRDGCDIAITAQLVDVVRELDKRLAITINGELDKKFAARIINRIFLYSEEPRIRRRLPLWSWDGVKSHLG